MREAVIVEAVRTAHGKRNGVLSAVHPIDLAADVLNAVVTRTHLPVEAVDDVVLGCVTQMSDQGGNVARYAVLAAGWPEDIPGVTINRACGSSQQALDYAAQAIMSGQAEVVIAGGVESMSRVPIGSTRATGLPYGPRMRDRYRGFDFNQGNSAELIAQRWELSRHDLDAFSVDSHHKAANAVASGAFESQIVVVDTESGKVGLDEGVRATSTVESLSGLRPAFTPNGLLTAGNSSQIADGAAALLLMTPERARELGLQPLVRYHSGTVVGADPVLMLTAPIPATQRLLKRTGIPLSDIGVFEVNEAFASVPLAWLHDIGADPARVNPLGGAIALGHPLGASGASLMTRMVHHMRAKGLRYGLQTMCEGGGTANATLVELVE